MSRTDDLYEAAARATPGPWRADEKCGHELMGGLVAVLPGANFAREEAVATGECIAHTYSYWRSGEQERADGTYIAKADPQTVMALVEAYRAAETGLRAAIDTRYGGPRSVSIEKGNSLLADLRAAIEKVEALG